MGSQVTTFKDDASHPALAPRGSDVWFLFVSFFKLFTVAVMPRGHYLPMCKIAQMPCIEGTSRSPKIGQKIETTSHWRPNGTLRCCHGRSIELSRLRDASVAHSIPPCCPRNPKVRMSGGVGFWDESKLEITMVDKMCFSCGVCRVAALPLLLMSAVSCNPHGC